jgi:hypothetical protein
MHLKCKEYDARNNMQGKGSEWKTFLKILLEETDFGVKRKFKIKIFAR